MFVTGIDAQIYVSLDLNGAWQMDLARELKSAGFEIDMNKLVQ